MKEKHQALVYLGEIGMKSEKVGEDVNPLLKVEGKNNSSQNR